MDARNAEEREEGETPFYEKEFCNTDGTMTIELHRAADCSDGAGDLNDAMQKMLDAEWQKEMGSESVANLHSASTAYHRLRTHVCASCVSYNVTAPCCR